MQQRNYQNLQEEHGTELPNYSENIPVGEPVPAYNNAAYYPNPQFIPAPPQPNFPPHQNFNHPPPPPPIIMQNLPSNQPGAQAYNYPVTILCPCCKMTVPTVVNLEQGNTTYMWCAFIGCCVSPLCCCVPFLMDSCLDKSHYCPNCGHNILRKHQRCFEFLGC